MPEAPEPQQPSQPPTTGVVGWFKRVTGRLSEVMAELEAEEAQKAATGKLAEPPEAPPTAPRAAGTAQLGGRSGPLGQARPIAPRAAGTGRIEEAKPVSPLSEAATRESNKRLAFIVDYMRHLKQPADNELFDDKPFVYRVLTEERTHQQHLAHALRKRLAEAGPNDDTAALDARLADALKKQSMIFTLMKGLTGRLGKTGGTGFLAEADD